MKELLRLSPARSKAHPFLFDGGEIVGSLLRAGARCEQPIDAPDVAVVLVLAFGHCADFDRIPVAQEERANLELNVSGTAVLS